MMGSLFALMFLAFGLTFVQYRKGFLGPVTGIKTFATGRLIPTDMVRCAVGAANITIGQAVYLATGKVLPASSQADAGTLAGNQEAFHDAFVGFALEAATANQSALIPIATAGVMELDCASATFEIGDSVGLSEDGGGTYLLPTTGIAVASRNLALGRCCEKVAVAATRVKIAFQSTVMFGGPQDMM